MTFKSHTFGPVEVYENAFNEWVVKRAKDNAEWCFQSPGPAIAFGIMCGELTDKEWRNIRTRGLAALEEWYPTSKEAAE